MQSIFSKLKVRLLVIHFIAFIFFTLAFQILAHLRDYNFLFLASEHLDRLNFPKRFIGDMEFIQQAGNIGLLAAYVISWTICTKYNWHWINSVLIFLLLFLVRNFLLPYWVVYNSTIMKPGGFFNVYSIWGHIALAATFVAIGLAILFSKKIIKYIDGNKSVDKKNQKNTKVKR